MESVQGWAWARPPLRPLCPEPGCWLLRSAAASPSPPPPNPCQGLSNDLHRGSGCGRGSERQAGKNSAHSDYCEQHLPDRWNNLNIWLRGGADKRSDLKVEDVPFCFCRICWDWTAEKADHVILTIFSFSDSVRSSSVNCLQSQRGMKSAQKPATKSRGNHSTKSLFHSRTRHQIRSSFSS